MSEEILSDSGFSFVGTSDISGVVRGKSFPSYQWDNRQQRGVGWTTTNIQITCFYTIAESPFGSFGDLALVPDPSTRFQLPCCKEENQSSDFSLGDILELDGQPWAFCLRSKAKKALTILYEEFGLLIRSAFEHEFQVPNSNPNLGDSFGFRGFREAEKWAHDLMNAFNAAGIKAESFMKEYGPSQFEISIHPTVGIKSMDQAVLVRELTKDVLAKHGKKSSFSPILDPKSVGNGVHIHLSFLNKDHQPISHDAEDPCGMSETSKHFIGGVLLYLKNILAFLAPSEISYYRLTPHRWSAAFNNLGFRDREAAVRICPVTSLDTIKISEQFNFEIRAVDSAASPYLAMAAILFAGSEGIRQKIVPPEATQEDLSLLDTKTLLKRGIERLPKSLSEALDETSSSQAVRNWFGSDFIEVYLKHKAAELDYLKSMTIEEKCAVYQKVY
ncbi:MAG: glutamine synthetase family protein [Deltaproteobacteria bacterium]